MARASYGADVFSPIKSNFDDSVNGGSESDLFDQWREPYAGRKNENSEVKKKPPYVPLLQHHAVKASSKDKLQSDVKIEKSAQKRNKKDLTSERDLTRFSYVTTRSRNSHKDKELGEIPENPLIRNDKASKTRKRTPAVVDSNKELFASITKLKSSLSSVNPADSNNKLPAEKIKQKKESSLVITADLSKELPRNKNEQNKDLVSPSLCSLVEEELLKITATDSVKPKEVGESEVQAQTRKATTKSNVTLKNKQTKSNKLERHATDSVKRGTQIEKPVLNIDCDEVACIKENQGAVADDTKEESFSMSSDSKPEQIQANIIEKLVTDAVRFELDGIRQMLYMQHLQLLRHIDNNTVVCELQHTIEDLVEENRKLKNIITDLQKT